MVENVPRDPLYVRSIAQRATSRKEWGLYKQFTVSCGFGLGSGTHSSLLIVTQNILRDSGIFNQGKPTQVAYPIPWVKLIMTTSKIGNLYLRVWLQDVENTKK